MLIALILIAQIRTHADEINADQSLSDCNTIDSLLDCKMLMLVRLCILFCKATWYTVFLHSFHVEVRHVIYTTNGLELTNNCLFSFLHVCMLSGQF